MAFFLTPRFSPSTNNTCNPFTSNCAPVLRPIFRQRVSRPAFPSFVPFLSQVDELLTELDREARRAAHQARQQRKQAFRARFDVREKKEGYEVEGEVPGFEQENIEVQVSDEYTLSVRGNTETKVEQAKDVAGAEAQAEPSQEEKRDSVDGVTITEQEISSDTESHKSYQPTVEDDFEDLGAETSSTLSTGTSPETREPKGKEEAVEQRTTAELKTAETQPQQEVHQQEPESLEWLNERVHGSFERTFRFPVRIDAENVRAALRNGVLSIQVPKAPVPEIRHIAIR
ncbi:HSP20-like chaperone [Lindgomyces ingoldianus]|uniref:HSP20-like chaperone n=1 Tax=Lindgomyces ingoldianus TaxID=673940 RepID=A0ACB6QL51_9PLEO|nr:HSP20-like chaperone [Lindgomyces ingoldianus]KAF2466852.1 HSP20-like chaperone [Lindgomyces ingoldianus]